jgi:hypothetical protein
VYANEAKTTMTSWRTPIRHDRTRRREGVTRPSLLHTPDRRDVGDGRSAPILSRRADSNERPAVRQSCQLRGTPPDNGIPAYWVELCRRHNARSIILRSPSWIPTIRR